MGYVGLIWCSAAVAAASWSSCECMLQLSQGNYATQNNSGMCHVMPRQHLPEWREEDEQAFVHCGSSGQNHAITSNQICHKAFQGVICHFVVTSCKCS